MDGTTPRPLEWVGSSKADLKAFPDEVQDHIGFALYQAQIGLKHRDAKPLTGLGSGVLEVVSDFDKSTFRAVYTVRFRDAVYVLHAFQKKSKRGIATPHRELELVRQRMRSAEAHYQQHYERERTR